MAKTTNAGLGALEALRGDSQENSSPDRWRTCNMDYGNFYKKAEKQQQPRPQTVPNLNLDALHEKCEKKWEALAKQLEHCRSEVEHLRVQKRGGTPGSNKSPGDGSPARSPRCGSSSRAADEEETSIGESPLTTSRCEYERGGSSPGRSSYGVDRSHEHDCCKIDDGKVFISRKDYPGKNPQRIFNICIRRSPSPQEEEDEKCEKCDRCKMLEEFEGGASTGRTPRSSPRHSPSPRHIPSPKRSKKRWRKKLQPPATATPATATPSDSSVHPATSKYNYYKYYGFAGHGAKTSWGHNFPLGLTPPYSVKAPPDL